jgi:hypothetical protein
VRLPVACPACLNGYLIEPSDVDAVRCGECGGEGFRWVQITRAAFNEQMRKAA